MDVTAPIPAAVAAPKRLKYTHRALIDYIIANPGAKQTELARAFERSNYWVYCVLNTDAFQAALEERREELLGSELMATVRDRYNLVASKSAELVARRLEEIDRMSQATDGQITQANEDFLLRSAELAAKALGYGATKSVNQTNVAVVVQVPAKIASSADWQATYTPPAEPA